MPVPAVAPMVTLKNSPTGDLQMPAIGLGTWQAPANVTKAAVISAIRDGGYRCIDTANDYGNEHEVGDGIKFCLDEGIVKREELFVQSKLWNANMRPDLVKLDLLATLKDLKLDYIDSYIIHWPQCAPANPNADKPALAWNVAHCAAGDLEAILTPGEHNNNFYGNHAKETMFPMDDEGMLMCDPSVHYTDTWKAMEKLVDEGLVKSIGISNFNFGQVLDLLQNGVTKYKPAVLQNEVHLYLQEKDLYDFCVFHGIQLQAYSPLGSHGNMMLSPAFQPEYRILDNPLVKELAEKYGKDVGQIALKSLIQRGLTLITKSQSEKRIISNIQVFDFELSRDDMDRLGKLNCKCKHLLWPQVANHPDYPFKDDMPGVTKAAAPQKFELVRFDTEPRVQAKNAGA